MGDDAATVEQLRAENRRLRELYPDVRVKLFYGKDFRALMLKYGRVDLVASLSGLEGQIMPRPASEPELEVEEVALEPAQVVPAVLARRSRPRVSRGSRRRRGRRAYLAARSAA